MLRPFMLCAFLSFFQMLTSAQDAEKLRLTSNDLEGMEETRFSVFSENSLWGYINGGADIYLEYGFKELVAQNLEWQSEPFKVEVYIMDNPMAAFGIFTVSRFSCEATGRVSEWDCVNPYQVQVAHGSMYISVVAYTGTEKSMQLATQIAKMLVEKSHAKPIALPEFLLTSDVNFVLPSVKYITGPLAIQNAYATLELPFHGHEGYKLWLAPYSFKGNKYDMLVAYFKNNAECDAVNQQIVKNDGFYTIVSGEKLLIAVGEGVEEDKGHIKMLKELQSKL
ncbi:MAG: hypothetical protein RBT19_04535 [Tenuifilaceae bacterium]|jgi:hypothetical protein|nr:hypothetical protein [Tenuifilaceae bacterium]